MQQKLTLLLGVVLGAAAASVLRVAVVGPVTVEQAPSADRLITIDSATFPLDPEGFYATVPWNGILSLYTVPSDKRLVVYGWMLNSGSVELVQEVLGQTVVRVNQFGMAKERVFSAPIVGIVFEPGATVGLRSKETNLGLPEDAQAAFTFFGYLADV